MVSCINTFSAWPDLRCSDTGFHDSIFPVRGQPELDRDYRHPRTRVDKYCKSSAGSTKLRRPVADGGPPLPRQCQADNWELLPPLQELVDGVNLFTRQYFQLGFIAKEQYPERLRKDLRSTSLFLLMSILSISARLSPAFRVRYGNGVKAAEYFMERASSIAVEEVYQEPTLERCQAFYLLSIAQQGSGERNKSYVSESRLSAYLVAYLVSPDANCGPAGQYGNRNQNGNLDAAAPRGNLSHSEPNPGADYTCRVGKTDTRKSAFPVLINICMFSAPTPLLQGS
jgi:hypothetical protein